MATTGTVIDSLTVLLSLDPSKFSEGQKKALADLKALGKAGKESGKEIEDWGESANNAYALARNGLLKFLTLLTGGKALKDFVVDTTNAGAALSRLAFNTGQSAKDIGQWAEAVRLAGGNADEAQQTMLNFTNELTKFNLTGQSDLPGYLRAIGVQLVDVNGKTKSAVQLFKDIANSPIFQKMDVQQKGAFLRMIGMDESTIFLLEQGKGAIDDYLDRARKVGNLNDQQVQSLQNLQTAWRNFFDTFSYGLKEWWADISSALGGVLNSLTRGQQYFRDQMVKQGVIPGDSRTGGQPLSTATNADGIYALIQKLEGANDNSQTPTGKPSDPYAYGRNQITLGTAQRYDPSATAAKLLDPNYNAQMARIIEADLAHQFGDDPEAIAIGYNAGPGAARRFLASGRDASVLPSETQAYLARERAYTNGNTTTVHIDNIEVNTQATDAGGIASGIGGALRDKLSGPRAVVLQSNQGGQ